MDGITQEQFPGMEQTAAVNTFQLTRENLERMAQAQREEDGLLNFPQAAIILGVTRQRVGELTMLGLLRRFSFCGQHYVSFREIRARAASDVKAGRPPRSLGSRVKATVKATLLTDKAQAANGGFAGPRYKRKK